MIILYATDRYAIGGGMEYIYQLCKGLSDHSIFVIGKGWPPPKNLLQLPNVTCLEGHLSRALIKKINPDIIHTNHLRSLLQLIPTLFANKYTVVNTVHGVHLHQFEYRHGIGNWIRFHFRRILEGWLIRKVDENILLNAMDADYCRRVLGISNGVVIPNGLEAANSTIAPLSDVARHFECEGTKFLTIARFHFQKGYEVLVRAISQIENLEPNLKASFIFAGDGELFEDIQQLVISLKISHRVHFLGKIENASKLMPLADCLILPSLWEGFPLVLLEAGHAKIPVIASNTYGNTELIHHNLTGILFANQSATDLAKAISEACASADTMTMYANELKSLVDSSFSIERMVASTHTVYRRLRKP